MIDFFKNTLLELSKNSKCVSKRVSCLIVKDNRIISMGINGTLSKCQNCDDIFTKSFDRDEHHKWSLLNELHAEQNALVFAAKNGTSVSGCTCYTSLQPCNLCLLLLIQAGIKEIFYLYDYDKSNYSQDVLNFIKNNHITLRKF